MSYNLVILEGFVGKDPETRSTSNQKKMTTFSIATTEHWKDASGNKQSSTDWHNCVSFGPVAGIIERYVSKGSNILIEGKLKNNNYTDSGGNQVRQQQVMVSSVVLLKGNTDSNRADKDDDTEPESKPQNTPKKPRQKNKEDDDPNLPF